MELKDIFIFDNDDNIYQEWIKNNNNGFVINTPRSIEPTYLVVHNASCRLIKQYNEMAQPGGFTERQYIKVCCEDLETLREWAIKHGGPGGVGFTKCCSFCMK